MANFQLTLDRYLCSRCISLGRRLLRSDWLKQLKLLFTMTGTPT